MAISAMAVGVFSLPFYHLLIVLQLKVVLDEIASGQCEVNFRVNTYLPVYTEILGLMNKCDTSEIHCTKTKTLRKQWARLGRYVFVCT